MDYRCKGCGRHMSKFWFERTGICATCQRFGTPEKRMQTDKDLTSMNGAYKVNLKEANE